MDKSIKRQQLNKLIRMLILYILALISILAIFTTCLIIKYLPEPKEPPVPDVIVHPFDESFYEYDEETYNTPTESAVAEFVGEYMLYDELLLDPILSKYASWILDLESDPDNIEYTVAEKGYTYISGKDFNSKGAVFDGNFIYSEETLVFDGTKVIEDTIVIAKDVEFVNSTSLDVNNSFIYTEAITIDNSATYRVENNWIYQIGSTISAELDESKLDKLNLKLSNNMFGYDSGGGYSKGEKFLKSNIVDCW